MTTKSRLTSRLLLSALCLCPASSTLAEQPRLGILDLAGSWRFHVGDPEEGAAAGLDDSGWSRVVIPATGGAIGIDREIETLWLRREIDLGKSWEQRLAPSGLAILIDNTIHGDYEIFAGGELIGQRQVLLPGIREPPPRIWKVPRTAVDARGRVQFAMRWHWTPWAPDRRVRHDSLIGDGWFLGDLERIRAEAELEKLRDFNSDLPLLILTLFYLSLGLYHLHLFRRNRRFTEYLWFGLTAIIVAFHSLLFTHWAASVPDPYGILRRLFGVSGTVMIAAWIQFLWPFLGQRIGRVLRAYQLSFLFFALSIAASPSGSWVALIEMLSKGWAILFFLAVAWLLANGLRSGRVEARSIAVGGFAVVVVGMVETGSQLLGLGTTYPLLEAAFIVFAISMAVALSNRFSRVHHDLDALRQQLEGMVEDRTEELSNANERLRSEISERELAQEAMRMLERAVEQSIDGVLISDLEGETLFINEAWARLHDYETVEILGRSLGLFHTPEQLERHVGPALQRVKEEGSWEGVISHCRKGGAIFPTWMSVTLLRDPKQEPVGFVIVARDITERERAEEEKLRIESQLQQAEKLSSLGNLAGGIAHDYNNLLTAVLGNSSLALRELPPGSLASEKLIQIGAAAERAADLTAQLLAYAGDEAIVAKKLDIDTLVNESRSELARCAGEARLEIVSAGQLPKIEVDPSQVRQAIINLVSNAAEAVAEVGGGTVQLETGGVAADRDYFAGSYPDEDCPAGNYVFVRVSDTGPGIDPERRSRIFDPFFSTKKSSRGLGLATVLSVARAHGGTIRVTSRPREGATFELLFPALGGRLVEMAPPEKGRQWQGTGTVLVVDDEHIMREVSRSILEQDGFTVLSTGEGRRALEIYQEHMEDIRVVLLDRTMPTMSGVEVLKRIRVLNPKVMIVLMSGYKPDAEIRDLTTSDLTDFLPKPFRPRELLDIVKRSVSGR